MYMNRKNQHIVLFLLLILCFPVFTSAQSVPDADILSPTRRNKQFIQRERIHVRQVTVDVGKQRFVINVFSKKGTKSQTFVVVHDSEDAAFDTGLRAIKHGGTFIALENHEGRPLFSYGSDAGVTHQDPNRMFNKDNPYWPVAKKILELLNGSPHRMIFTLHNNKPGGNFRIDTIATWKNISILSHADKDKRSLVWIPFSQPHPDKKLADEIAFYKKKRMNVVCEYVPENERGDGSLSVYASKHAIPYRNIEVEAGVRGNRHSELKSRRKQMRYLRNVRKYLGI
jgi:hypothetical protein